ncbi:MAG: rhodanese-like domain-containing protein [Verrucomicrobiota bacterium]|nr:rhodanese-like domain-containing protein [Verrucomicrobiota bacterium]
MIARALRQLGLLLAVALLPALVSGAIQLKWNKEEPLREGEVRLATAQLWGAAVLWVDARPRARFEREHIPGAVLLNEDEWEQLVPGFLDAWNPEQTIVVYCDGGECDASHAVGRRLKEELKLDNSIWVLKGGWDAWRRR